MIAYQVMNDVTAVVARLRAYNKTNKAALQNFATGANQDQPLLFRVDFFDNNGNTATITLISTSAVCAKIQIDLKTVTVTANAKSTAYSDFDTAYVAVIDHMAKALYETELPRRPSSDYKFQYQIHDYERPVQKPSPPLYPV